MARLAERVALLHATTHSDDRQGRAREHLELVQRLPRPPLIQQALARDSR
jgi:hypothetical protein